jgi:hypothetical protein
MDEDRPYAVYSPTQIWMSPAARESAKEHGMSEQEMGRYLIAQHIERGDVFVGDAHDESTENADKI